MSGGFNNPIVGGGGTLVYPAIHNPNYVLNVTGWSINKDGTAQFTGLVLIGGIFTGTNFVINSSGAFFYSGAPAAGNLIASIAAAAGNDSHGNAYVQGLGVYITTGLIKHVLTFGQQNNIPGMSVNQASGGAFQTPLYGVLNDSNTGASLYLYSGQALNTSLNSVLEILDSTSSGKPQGMISLLTGFVALGNSENWWIDDSLTPSQLLTGAAGSGPFINGELFHAISLGSGLSGTLRVKKLPWNAVWIDVELTITTSGGVSISCGSLPDATYYPTIARHFPLSLTGAAVLTSGSFLGTPRVHIPTSGAITIEIPTLSASAALTLGCSVMYPTN